MVISCVLNIRIILMRWYWPLKRCCPQTKSQKGNVLTSLCQEFCPQGGGRGGVHPWADTSQADTSHRQKAPLGRYSPGQTPSSRHPRAGTPSQEDGYCSGRYASYWNVFLFSIVMGLPFKVWINKFDFLASSNKGFDRHQNCPGWVLWDFSVLTRRDMISNMTISK